MTPTFKAGMEKAVKDFFGKFNGNVARGNTKNVGVVVFPRATFPLNLPKKSLTAFSIPALKVGVMNAGDRKSVV